MKDIIETHPEKIKTIKDRILQAGPENFHVLADFDRTLTKAFVGDQKVPSLISILRDEGYLTQDYPAKAKALYNKYHQIEIDSDVSYEDKRSAMHEWWSKHFELLIASGLSKSDIEHAMLDSGRVEFREKTSELLDLLHQLKIPLIVLSSSGLGGDSISLFLRRHQKLYKNVHIISNSFEWNKEGKAVKVHQPIIHSMNKDETVVRDFPFYQEIKKRKNVILLGDNENDIDMITGFDYTGLIKVGFLNEKVEERLEQYKEKFDVVISNDGSMEYVFNLIKDLT
ncbi:hypothetical protein KKG41_04030 [Patescibacteria group bacterium]|nr:hypothetical protein [Patescibacteria group bacterium]MBU1891045.1 hypothetical protein [Patescibacteria group bacterium]